MGNFRLGNRIAQIVPTLILVSILVFGLQQLMPGDPALVMAGEQAGDPQVVAQIRKEMLLDRPIPEQYFHWIGNVLRGNLGFSWHTRQPVAQLIVQKLPVTAQLGVMAFIIAILIGVPTGVLAAVKRNGPLDYVANAIGLAGLSMPTFWLGIMLILLVSVDLNLLPPSGYVPLTENVRQSLATTIMPAFVLGNAIAAILMRHTRSAMLSTLDQDYVRTARAKGLSKNARHPAPRPAQRADPGGNPRRPRVRHPALRRRPHGTGLLHPRLRQDGGRCRLQPRLPCRPRRRAGHRLPVHPAEPAGRYSLRSDQPQATPRMSRTHRPTAPGHTSFLSGPQRPSFFLRVENKAVEAPANHPPRHKLQRHQHA